MVTSKLKLQMMEQVHKTQETQMFMALPLENSFMWSPMKVMKKIKLISREVQKPVHRGLFSYRKAKAVIKPVSKKDLDLIKSSTLSWIKEGIVGLVVKNRPQTGRVKIGGLRTNWTN